VLCILALELTPPFVLEVAVRATR
jgi:hypothetical protein